MRYKSDHKQQSRLKLLKAGGALAKEKGFGVTGLDSLMAAAGMTTGAFYSQFSSKTDFLSAIIEYELRQTFELFQVNSHEELISAFESYLSVHHIQHPETGCVTPVLASEIARSDLTTKEVFEKLMLQIIDLIDLILKDKQKSISIVCQSIGAIVLARAFAHEENTQLILNTVLDNIKKQLQACIDEN